MGLCPVLAGVGACPAVALHILGGIAARWPDQIVRETFQISIVSATQAPRSHTVFPPSSATHSTT